MDRYIYIFEGFTARGIGHCTFEVVTAHFGWSKLFESRAPPRAVLIDIYSCIYTYIYIYMYIYMYTYTYICIQSSFVSS